MKEIFNIPYILRDGVILQRGMETNFWGYTGSEKRVRLFYEDYEASTLSDGEGYFAFKLPAHEAAGPLEFVLSTDEGKRTVKDIFFGDVFLLAGQSNMQLWMGRLKERYSNELQKATNKKIHFFEVPQVPSFGKREKELNSEEWKCAVGDNLEALSGIGYFFAKQHYEETQVPVGLISTAVGGTPINSWLSEQSLKALGLLPDNFTSLKNEDYIRQIQKLDQHYQEDYQRLCEASDKGMTEHWEIVDFDDSKWEEEQLNEEWDDKHCYPGIIWFRKCIEIPENMVGKSAEFRLGTFTDADEIFVNGNLVGSTEYKYPPRNYSIGELTKKLTIAIRLKIYNFPGEIKIDKRHLIVSGLETLDLDVLGPWKMKRSCWLPERKEEYFLQNEPTGLFNGMIAPLKNLKFSAILWYQGESDGWRPENYGLRFCKLIQEWRQLFNQSDLPFLFVQLPNCGTEIGSRWPELRREQEKALVLNWTAMVVALGYGEDNDLHPLNKKNIAEKLYDSYLNINNFSNGYCSGPLAIEAIYKEKEINILFQTFGKRLISDYSGYFEIYEEGRIKKMKNYHLVNNGIKIRLPSSYVPSQTSYLRYNWNNTPKPFIRDNKGSPAAPFELKIGF